MTAFLVSWTCVIFLYRYVPTRHHERGQFLNWLYTLSLTTTLLPNIIDRTITLVLLGWLIIIIVIVNIVVFVILACHCLKMVGQTHTSKRLWLILSWIVDYADITASRRGNLPDLSIEVDSCLFVISIVYSTLNGVVLVNVLDTQELVLLVCYSSTSSILITIIFICVSWAPSLTLKIE